MQLVFHYTPSVPFRQFSLVSHFQAWPEFLHASKSHAFHVQIQQRFLHTNFKVLYKSLSGPPPHFGGTYREVKWHPSELNHSVPQDIFWRQKPVTPRNYTEMTSSHLLTLCFSKIPFKSRAPRTISIIKEAETLQFHHFQKCKYWSLRASPASE